MRFPFYIALLFSILIGLFMVVLTGSWIVGLVVALHIHILWMVYGVSNIRSGFFVKAVSKVNVDENAIMLSFDDGPDKLTPVLLEVLKKHDVKAAFFLIGHKVTGGYSTIQQMHADGHLIGNHSYSHQGKFYFWPKRKMITDIKQANDEIKKVTGVDPRFFRPPFGVTNPPLARALKNFNMLVVGWKIRTFDTVKPLDFKMQQRILQRIKGGDIILFHDTTPGIVEFIDQIIPMLKQKGFKFVVL